MNELEIVRVTQFNTLHTPVLLSFDNVLLTDDREVRFVREQAEHDEIGIGTVETMSCVGVVVWSPPQLPNVVQHLVLTFAWHGTV